MDTCKLCGQPIPKKPASRGTIYLNDVTGERVATLVGRDHFMWNTIPTKDQITKVRLTVRHILGFLPPDRHHLL